MKYDYYPNGHEGRALRVYRGTEGRPICLRSVYYDGDAGGWVINSGDRIAATFPTLRGAKRAARHDIRQNEVRRRMHGTVIRAHAWRDRLKSWPNECKIRHGLKQPAFRWIWRGFSYPQCLSVDRIEARLGPQGVSELWRWLAERDLSGRYYSEVVFAAKRTGRRRRMRAVATDVIDFPDENSRFEFRMRWL